MAPTSSRTRHPGHVVTAIVICRDGAKRLPKTLDALALQVRRVDRVVAVDLGSSDRSVAVATERLGAAHVAKVDAGAGIGTAIAAGLELVSRRPDRRRHDDAPVEWLWLLHDDSAPEPDALDELLLRVVHSPSVWLAGPKVLDWSGAVLVQAGLAIDAAGHIETGIDRREPDQGQRDDVDEVLAVGVAGSLIRRDVWDALGGMDPQLADYGAEVDLGWRVNASGGRVVVVSRAVLRHAGEECVGDRPGGPALRAMAIERRNGMRVVLANTAGWLVPLLLVRYLLVGVLHSLALVVLSRRPREAAAELRAVGVVLATPGAIVAARRSRAVAREVGYGDLRRLFPPSGRWMSNVMAARAHSGTAPDAPLARRRVAVESGPVSEEVESLADEISAVGEFLRRPAALLVIVMGLLAVIADRHLLSGTVHGGRLLPVPAGASDLWSSYFNAWHPSNVGSTAPTSPSIALVALLATILLGKAWLAVDIIVLGAVPLAALSAYTSLRLLTTAVRIRIWVSVVYALLPAVTGAISSGRLDVIVAAIVLPRVVRSIAIAWQRDSVAPLQGRVLRAGLWLAVAAAFAPLLWALVALVCGAVLGAERSSAADAMPDRLRATAGVLVIPLIVLMPWTWHVVAHPSLLFSGSGLPEFYGSHSPPSGILLALLHAGGPGQPPFWVGIPIVGALVFGLQRDSRVAVARIGAAVFVLGLAIAIIETRGASVTTGFPTTRHWPGLALLVAGAGALVTAVVAAVGARPALRDRSFGWRQPAVVAVVGLAVVATGTLVVGWVSGGVDKPLRGGDAAVLPLYVQAELALPTSSRALVLGGDAHLVHFALVRTPHGPLLGSGDAAPSGRMSDRANARLADAVQDLVAGRAGAGAELVPFGIDYLVAPQSTARRIASQLGRASTLTVIPVPSATVWHSSLATGELTVLSGAAATVASEGSVPQTAPVQVLNAGSGSSTARVPSATTSRLLVLAEPADSRWRATLAGQSLRRATAYGWAQAFVLPPRAGTVHVSFDSSGRHWWLIAELVGLVGVLLVGAGAAPHGHRRGAP